MSQNIADSMAQHVTNLNPWLNIWFKPRATIRQIVEQKPPEKYVLLLAVISGVFRGIDQAAERSLGDFVSMWGILGFAFVVGPIAGIVSLYLCGALFQWTGNWLGGKATDRDVRIVYAWSSIVDIIGLIIFIPIVLIFGQEWFESSANWASSSIGLFIAILVIPLGLTLLIWRAIIFLAGLAEVHNFSIWKSLGATMLGFLVVLTPILCFLIPMLLTR